jgi:hypothetical protein
MFLGLPDPDPLVRGTDPDPASDPSLSYKCVEQTEIMPAKYNPDPLVRGTDRGSGLGSASKCHGSLTLLSRD